MELLCWASYVTMVLVVISVVGNCLANFDAKQTFFGMISGKIVIGIVGAASIAASIMSL